MFYYYCYCFIDFCLQKICGIKGIDSSGGGGGLSILPFVVKFHLIWPGYTYLLRCKMEESCSFLDCSWDCILCHVWGNDSGNQSTANIYICDVFWKQQKSQQQQPFWAWIASKHLRLIFLLNLLFTYKIYLQTFVSILQFKYEAVALPWCFYFLHIIGK